MEPQLEKIASDAGCGIPLVLRAQRSDARAWLYESATDRLPLTIGSSFRTLADVLRFFRGGPQGPQLAESSPCRWLCTEQFERAKRLNVSGVP